MAAIKGKSIINNTIFMNKSEKFVITINRELGSGGRSVGRKVAERLGVNFYDKAVVKAMEEKYNLNVEEIEKLKGESHGKWIDIKRMEGTSDGIRIVNDRIYQVNPGEEFAQETTEEMFRTEQEVLRAIADEQSCVVAGRCGFYVFRDHPNHLNVLIQASMPYRVERLARKKNMTADEASKLIEQVDAMRENYVKHFTGTSRYDTRNYDIMLRADGMTEDELADIIVQYISK